MMIIINCVDNDGIQSNIWRSVVPLRRAFNVLEAGGKWMIGGGVADDSVVGGYLRIARGAVVIMLGVSESLLVSDNAFTEMIQVTY